MKEYSNIYTNIFQAYLGSGLDKEIQIENNCTRALINTLLHSDDQLTCNFINFCAGREIVSQTNEVNKYLLQPSLTEDMAKCKRGFILAITDKLIKKTDNKKEGRADAALIFGDTLLLIETKLPGNTLDNSQLERHKDTYFDSQEIVDNSIKNWSEVLIFFQSQKEVFTKEKHPITNFLVSQFEEFCEINGLGVMNEDYHIRNLPKESQVMAKTVLEYISEMYNGQLRDLKNVKGGIAFQKENTAGYFAKIATGSSRNCLILYFSKSNQSVGLDYQRKFNEIGIGNRRTVKDDEKYPNEAYINLSKVKEINEITKYIHDAFIMRP